jgi:hypothetical protein
LTWLCESESSDALAMQNFAATFESAPRSGAQDPTWVLDDQIKAIVELFSGCGVHTSGIDLASFDKNTERTWGSSR